MLQPDTFLFLAELAQNNNRDWFDQNRERYQNAKADVIQLIGSVQQYLTDAMPELALQPAKDTLFRIFRDVRFSKDKTPYKKHFGAYLSKGGRKWEGAGYYLHIEPGNCFLATGIWEPLSPLLKALRQELDYNWEEWQTLTGEPAFKKHFRHWEAQAQKTTPKGYTADNPAIDFIKRKSIIATMPLSEEMLQQKRVDKKLAAAILSAGPVTDFLNRAFD